MIYERADWDPYILEPHSDECFFKDDLPVGIFIDTYVHNGGLTHVGSEDYEFLRWGQRYIEARCNTPKCHGRYLVNLQWLEKQVEKVINGQYVR